MGLFDTFEISPVQCIIFLFFVSVLSALLPSVSLRMGDRRRFFVLKVISYIQVLGWITEKLRRARQAQSSTAAAVEGADGGRSPRSDDEDVDDDDGKKDDFRARDPPHPLKLEGAPFRIYVPVLPLRALIEQTGNPGSISLVGEGSRAKVFRAVLGDKIIAMKMFHKPQKHECLTAFMLQLSVMSRLKHENVVELLGYNVEGGQRLLAYEFAAMGSLQDILHCKESGNRTKRSTLLNWDKRVRIACEAAKGLEYLHEKAGLSVVHKNIKSSNILIFEDFSAKIADFELLNPTPDLLSRVVFARFLGPFGYHAPECVKYGVQSQQTDVYSFGIVMLELLTGRKPVDLSMPVGEQSLMIWVIPRLTDETKLQQIVDPDLMGSYPLDAVAEYAQVAARCVLYDAKRRPKMSFVAEQLTNIATQKPRCLPSGKGKEKQH